MNCPRCGKAISAGNAFCPHCGQSLQQHPNPAPGYAGPSTVALPLGDAFAEQRRRKSLGVAALLALLVFAAIVLGFGSNGLLQQLAGTSPGNSLQKGGASGSPILQKPGASGPSSLEKVAEVAPPILQKQDSRITMPDDIRNWLEHLHQTEIARVDATNAAIGNARVEQAKDSVSGGAAGVQSALDGIDDPESQLKSPVEGLARMIKAMHDQVADLQKKFDAFPAPAECIPIQASYDQALGEEASELGDLGDHLASGDINKLQSMEGNSISGIDSAGAKADRLVGEICDKYQTKKWFSINKDIAPGGALALPGF